MTAGGEYGRRAAAVVGLTEARRVLASTMSEGELQRQVLDLADLSGWLSYHTFDSRRSQPGFPDLVLVRAPRIVFAELKSMNGRVTQAQQTWLSALARCPQIETYEWRPDDWPQIEEVLKR